MNRRARSLRQMLLVGGAALLALDAATAHGQHLTGLSVSKTCPLTVAPGSAFQCSFTVRNQDTDHGILNLAVTNRVPYPGGPVSAVGCLQSGNPVTSLGPAGSPTESCSGTVQEAAPDCGPNDQFFQDEISASGNDADTGQFANLPVSASVTNGTTVPACPPHVTGFQVTKTCPASVASRDSFTCTFTVKNLDTQHGVDGLAVTNQVPVPGGPVSPVSCLASGVAVGSLGASGSPADSCSGTVAEKAPLNCGPGDVAYTDRVTASGTDADPGQFNGLPVSASISVAVSVQPETCATTEPTAPGTDVTVGLGTVTTTFSEVSIGGATTVTLIDPSTAGLPPGNGYSLSDLGIAYEISTTATVSGDITIGIALPDTVDELTFNALRVLHNENGLLVDRTYFSPSGCDPAPGSPCPAPDFATRTVYARVGSLSAFVLASFAGPSIQTITVPADPVAISTAVDVQATFTDSGTHTAEWEWGDGTTSPGTVVEAGGFGTVTGAHTYPGPGVYRVLLTVTDDEGLSAQRLSDFVVVYDPSGGFVTGGGWISSPAGAYVDEPSLTGKANFGFVSKYQKNASVPTGDTQFQFFVADFRFDSDAYQWMVISGAKARYRGVGKVNGAGSYGFELTAWDGQVGGGEGADRFRITIWDHNRGNAVVYDNQMNAAEGADPTTSLGGGSIVIHKGK